MSRPRSSARASWRARGAVAALVAIAALVRIGLNDAGTLGGVDEAHYLRTARALAPSVIARYPAAAAEYVSVPAAWKFPSLLRWGWNGLTGIACTVQPACSQRTLAWISTVAGIAVVVLAYGIGRARLGHAAALLGAAFVAASPLQLALGRRALQDELVCAAVLASLWGALRVLDAAPGSRLTQKYAVAIAAATFAFAVKETFALYAPAFVALWLFARARGRPARAADAVLLLAPPLAYYAGYCLLTRTGTQFFDMARLAVASLGSDYAREFQSGPPHRYLVDLLALSPATVVLAIAAAAVIWSSRGEDARGPAELATFVALALAVFALGSKSVRFVAASDALLSLLAGWVVVIFARRARRPARVLVACAALVVVSNAWIFDRVFLKAQVNDPTTYEVLRALEAIPP